MKMERETIQLLKNRTGGERISDSFNFIRINLGVLLQTQVLLSFPVIILTAALFQVLLTDYFSLLDTIGTGPFEDDVADRAERTQWIVGLLFGMMAIIPITVNTAIVFDLFARAEDKPVRFDAVWTSFKKNFLRLYTARFVISAIVAAASFLLFVPGLVFYNLFLVTELLMLQNNFSIGKALGRSFNVMSKVFWTAFWVNLGLLAIILAGNLAMQGLLPVLKWLASLVVNDVGEDEFWAVLGMSIAAFNSILGYMLYMLAAAAGGIQYFTLREEIGRANIMERVRAIGVAESANANMARDEDY
jgi:hypothetical protein